MVHADEELKALHIEIVGGVAPASARLEHGCASLDPGEEQACAEIGINADLADWPEH